MKNKLLLLAILLVLSGCADSMSLEQAMSVEEVGFWHGLWHGMIIPFAWLISLFDNGVSIYAIYNNGGWYDFGFIIGIGGLSGAGLMKS